MTRWEPRLPPGSLIDRDFDHLIQGRYFLLLQKINQMLVNAKFISQIFRICGNLVIFGKFSNLMVKSLIFTFLLIEMPEGRGLGLLAF